MEQCLIGGIRGRESFTAVKLSIRIEALNHFGRPRIQAVDLREGTRKPGIRIYSRGEIESAPRSCGGLREKTPDPFKFLVKGSGEVEQCAQRRAMAQKVTKVCLTPVPAG